MELSNVKERNKNLERKERQQVGQIKELKDQVEKLRNKSMSSESMNFEVKIELEEKEKLIRIYNDEIKNLKEQIEDQKISLNMQ